MKKFNKGERRQFINLCHYPSLHRSWGVIVDIYADGYVLKFDNTGFSMFVRESELI